MEKKLSFGLVAILIFVAFVLFVGNRFYIAVPAGHVAVASLFGDVQADPYQEGLHFPVNPLYQWHLYDTRQKTLAETAMVPSQDQLQTKIDISVQFYINGDMTPNILKTTGTVADNINVHLIPQLRSLIREQGKSIKRAEDFFMEETQNRLQDSILFSLQEYLQPKGIQIQAVLLRDIMLPQFIRTAIESKKEREQAAEKQIAELERFGTEQKQKVVAAEAERAAAEQMAAQKIILADAQAYEISKLNEAIAGNQAYIQLQALKTLNELSKNPASQIYFINSDSPTPLPLMHMGAAVGR